jgi:hypothetical protein
MKLGVAIVIAIAIATAVAVAAAGEAAAQTRTYYSVYCANDRIEVDSRSFDQMQIARGSDVCQFGQFNFLSDAQDFARENFGQIGADCSCGG